MNFQYFLLPGSYLRKDSLLSYHNQLFSFWQSSWSKVFSSLQLSIEAKPSEFLRQTYVSAIMTDDQRVVGLTLHTLFNLHSLAATHHPYLAGNYSKDLVQDLQNLNLNQILSIEFLTVAEEFRKKEAGFSVAKQLVSLAHRLQSILNVDACFSCCRQDFKIDLLEKQFGGEVLSSPGIVYGVETQNIITPTQWLKEPFDLKFMTDYLWGKRVSFEPTLAPRNELFSESGSMTHLN